MSENCQHHFCRLTLPVLPSPHTATYHWQVLSMTVSFFPFHNTSFFNSWRNKVPEIIDHVKVTNLLTDIWEVVNVTNFRTETGLPCYSHQRGNCWVQWWHAGKEWLISGNMVLLSSLHTVGLVGQRPPATLKYLQLIRKFILYHSLRF